MKYRAFPMGTAGSAGGGGGTSGCAGGLPGGGGGGGGGTAGVALCLVARQGLARITFCLWRSLCK